MQGLNPSAKPPETNTKGTALIRHAGGRGVGHYSPAHWQVLGPFPVPATAQSALDHNPIADQAALDPSKTKQVEGRNWKQIEGGDLNLAKITFADEITYANKNIRWTTALPGSS